MRTVSLVYSLLMHTIYLSLSTHCVLHRQLGNRLQETQGIDQSLVIQTSNRTSFKDYIINQILLPYENITDSIYTKHPEKYFNVNEWYILLQGRGVARGGAWGRPPPPLRDSGGYLYIKYFPPPKPFLATPLLQGCLY